MAPHSSTLAWKIPWREEPGGLQSMGSLRVRHDWATSLSLFTFMHWRRRWQPTPVFLPGESQGRGSLVGCLWGRTESDTTETTWRQKQQSSQTCSSTVSFLNQGSWILYLFPLQLIPLIYVWVHNWEQLLTEWSFWKANLQISLPCLKSVSGSHSEDKIQFLWPGVH